MRLCKCMLYIYTLKLAGSGSSGRVAHEARERQDIGPRQGLPDLWPVVNGVCLNLGVPGWWAVGSRLWGVGKGPGRGQGSPHCQANWIQQSGKLGVWGFVTEYYSREKYGSCICYAVVMRSLWGCYVIAMQLLSGCYEILIHWDLLGSVGIHWDPL